MDSEMTDEELRAVDEKYRKITLDMLKDMVIERNLKLREGIDRGVFQYRSDPTELVRIPSQAKGKEHQG